MIANGEQLPPIIAAIHHRRFANTVMMAAGTTPRIAAIVMNPKSKSRPRYEQLTNSKSSANGWLAIHALIKASQYHSLFGFAGVA